MNSQIKQWYVFKMIALLRNWELIKHNNKKYLFSTKLLPKIVWYKDLGTFAVEQFNVIIH